MAPYFGQAGLDDAVKEFINTIGRRTVADRWGGTSGDIDYKMKQWRKAMINADASKAHGKWRYAKWMTDNGGLHAIAAEIVRSTARSREVALVRNTQHMDGDSAQLRHDRIIFAKYNLRFDRCHTFELAYDVVRRCIVEAFNRCYVEIVMDDPPEAPAKFIAPPPTRPRRENPDDIFEIDIDSNSETEYIPTFILRNDSDSERDNIAQSDNDVESSIDHIYRRLRPIEDSSDSDESVIIISETLAPKRRRYRRVIMSDSD